MNAIKLLNLFPLDDIGNQSLTLQPELLTDQDFKMLLIAKVSYIVLSMMPIFWLLGIFPPLGKPMY